MQKLPEGLLVDAAWLEKDGYYGSLRKKYVTSGWLTQPTRRVYRRPCGPLTWQQVVISLQTLLLPEHPIVVGGRTALELQGFSHYLPFGMRKEVHLYGKEKPPGWLQKLPLSERFIFHREEKLFAGVRGLGSLSVNPTTGEAVNPDPIHGDFNSQPWSHWDWPLTLSLPERAIFELLDELPDRESFHQVDMLMGGLTNLSPRRLQKFLLGCRNIKVKRLFFWFADRHRHAWLKRIDRAQIDLGKGKRMIVRGGKLNTTYQITVPADMHDG